MTRLTLESMRADIAEMIGEDPGEIDMEDSLVDLGLDSIRAMMLVEQWKAAGVPLQFAELAEVPTLAHWWRVAERVQTGG
ncbi:phosphopantetheine-binding protein [Terrihabitans rhizophilus]|uniref:Phosphopantetheine-binding protein n=1 Tax=Terrihabitans rhizophilus TaxID=3092662 RepID=A0ABU4RJR4_9HYPH|nr:phosphopantetheine-binding protein [Terrihabitans sp. PJ23]MDX6805088.1 phosphopantetheine-binding protein [Terrihabitans sp. PJ23]